MSQPWYSRRGMLLAGSLALVAFGVALFLWARNGGEPDGQQPTEDGSDPSGRSDLATFREGTQAAGITFRMNFLPGEQGEKFKTNLYDHGCGVVVGDFDNDGHDDIYFLNQLGRNALYRNKGDGTFEDVTEKAGVGLGDRVCVGATFGDYDNDGYPDLYVTSTRGGNVLFHNNGDGTFTDVTKQAGLTHVGHSQTGVFFDYDNDGLLDLFVTNTATWTYDKKDPQDHSFLGRLDIFASAKSPVEYNLLYHNNGDGTFTDATEKAGLKGKGWSGDVAVFDYNSDGHLDLMVSNMFGRSQLYRNNGDGTFTDVAADVLKRTSFGTTGIKVFDFNNDGLLDVFMADMHSDMWFPIFRKPLAGDFDLTRKYLKYTGPLSDYSKGEDDLEKRFVDAFKIRYNEVLFGNVCFKQMPGGRFEEVSDKVGLETFWPWGVAIGDFDNNGYEDVFIASGMGYPYSYSPSVLLMNDGKEKFTDLAAEAGIEPPPGGRYLKDRIGKNLASRSSRCAAVADFDSDGRLDLIVNNFNDHPYYFRNHFPKKNWIAFRLTGTKSNRDAIGALVKIYMGQEVMVRQVQGAGGYLSQSSLTVHFGLGQRQKIDRVEISWPRSLKDKSQVIKEPAINQLHRVTEPSK